jgi:hypothetical protein
MPLKIIAAIFMLVFLSSLDAQQSTEARSAAMAFSNSAATRGIEHFGLNPATLALPVKFGFEFNLLSVNATARNNSFNKGQYDRYFTKGDTLTQQDKDDILSSVPADGLRVDGLARVNTIGFYMKNFSLSFFGIGASFAKVPGDIPVLIFKGNNEEGRVYQLNDFDGDGWGGLGVQVSGAYPVYKGNDPETNMIALGGTFKYIGGLGTFKVVNAEGEIRNYSTEEDQFYTVIDQKLEARTADGGSGFGLDFGAIARLNDKCTAGLTFINLFGKMSYKRNTEMHTYSIVSDSFSVSDELIETPDEIIVTEDSSYAIEPFFSTLPLVLDLGVAYQANEHFLLTAEYEQGASESLAGSKRSRIGFGMEFTQIPALPLRAGLSFGGRIGTSLALGFGIDLKNWILDLAYVGHGGIFPSSAKGLTLAATTRLRF